MGTMTYEEKLAAAAATFKDSRQTPAQHGDRSARLEPTFSDFDDEDLEEPERDTDYAAAYEEDDDLFEDSPDDEDDLFAVTPDEDDDTQGFIPPPDLPRQAIGLTVARPAVTIDPDLDDPDLEEDAEPEARDEEPYDEYEEDEAYDDDYDDDSYEDAGPTHRGRWPLGLIAVALVALLLLAAGGYGVVQERFAMQEQISQLNAALAAAGQVQETGSGEDLRALERLSEERARTIEALTVENRRLTDMVAGLESQLEAQNLSQAPAQGEAAAKPAPAPTAPEAQARPAAVAKPAPAKAAPASPPAATPTHSPNRPAAASTAGPAEGDWFVNFGSYSRSAVAESWARRLKPVAGKVVVTSADRDGASFYRVRIIDLADRTAAEQVSRQLEAQYGLPKLWVGRE